MTGVKETIERARIGREGLAIFPVFAVITFLTYWPVFSETCCSVFSPLHTRLSADVNLILWILSTVARSLWSNPFDLFGGNILYPEPAPIAGAEHMLAQQVFFAPLFALSGNPVWSMQWTLFLNATLCGVAMYLLLRHWRAAVPAAIFGGFVYAMFPSRYTGIHAPNVYAAQYLPLVILFLDRSVDSRRAKDAMLFGLFLALQMLTSFYLAYVSLAVVGAFSLGKALGQPKLDARAWAAPVLAAMVAGVLLGASALPYLDNATSGEFGEHRTMALKLASNSTWQSFLYSPVVIRLWGWRPAGMQNYLGVVPLVLAVVGCVAWWRPRARSPVLGLLIAAVVTYFMSLGPGPETSLLGRPYDWAASVLPGFSVMRVPSRFVAGVMLAVAVLAGFGFHSISAALLRRTGRQWCAYAALVVFGFATALEFGLFHVRLGSQQRAVGEDIPDVYRALAQLEKGPVLEIPAGVLDGTFIMPESNYGYFSIFHRQPLLNGYTGYRPPTYLLLMSLSRALPNPRALELLQSLTGLRYVVLHTDRMSELDLAPWRQPINAESIKSYGKDVLVELPPCDADLETAMMNNSGAESTVLGSPLRRLDDAARVASIELTPGQPLADRNADVPIAASYVRMLVRVEVENLSGVVWPVLALDPELVVHWAYRWQERDGDGWVPVGSQRRLRFAYDLAPGERTASTLRVLLPPYGGRFKLEIGLEQAGRWFSGSLEIPDVMVTGRKGGGARRVWRLQGQERMRGAPG